MKLILLGVLAVSCIGCSGMMSIADGERLTITGTEAGWRAFSDFNTGSIITGKASPDMQDAHTQMRIDQEATRKLKYMQMKNVKDRGNK